MEKYHIEHLAPHTHFDVVFRLRYSPSSSLVFVVHRCCSSSLFFVFRFIVVRCRRSSSLFIVVVRCRCWLFVLVVVHRRRSSLLFIVFRCSSIAIFRRGSPSFDRLLFRHRLWIAAIRRPFVKVRLHLHRPPMRPRPSPSSSSWW